jgi:hypothetical protein
MSLASSSPSRRFLPTGPGAAAPLHAAFLVACLVAGLAAPATAADGLAPPAAVSDPSAIDGVVAGRYYESWRERTCRNTSVCRSVFAKVPKGKVLRITNINCWQFILWAEDGPIVVRLLQGPTATPTPKAAYRVEMIPPEGPAARVYMLNTETSFFIESGRTPIVEIFPGDQVAQMSGQCAISGVLLDN